MRQGELRARCTSSRAPTRRIKYTQPAYQVGIAPSEIATKISIVTNDTGYATSMTRDSSDVWYSCMVDMTIRFTAGGLCISGVT